MSILFSKAKPGQCLWIVCDAVEGSRDHFGGRRVCGAAVSFPTSYCIGHRLRVYERRLEAPARPQDFTVQRHQPARETQPELTEIFG